MDNSRPNWDEYFINVAHEIAKRSTCPKLSVGAVVSKNNRIVSQGYNGSPKGLDHCSDVGCYENDLGHCTRVIHAEQNAILFANREDLNNSVMYLTHAPCLGCQKIIINSGISKVVYDIDYKTCLKWLDQTDIDVEKLKK